MRGATRRTGGLGSFRDVRIAILAGAKDRLTLGRHTRSFGTFGDLYLTLVDGVLDLGVDAFPTATKRPPGVPVHRSAKALGFGTESPLTARFSDLCRAIKAKRAAVQLARRSRVASALKT